MADCLLGLVANYNLPQFGSSAASLLVSVAPEPDAVDDAAATWATISGIISLNTSCIISFSSSLSPILLRTQNAVVRLSLVLNSQRVIGHLGACVNYKGRTWLIHMSRSLVRPQDPTHRHPDVNRV